MLVVVKIPEKVKAGGAKGHYYNRRFKENRSDKLIVMDQQNVGALGQGSCSKDDDARYPMQKDYLYFRRSYIRKQNKSERISFMCCMIRCLFRIC